MVLHHVADRPGLVVVIAALADADLLGDGDLDVIHVLAVPKRLEQDVAEADRHQVLHRLLAEIVVDAEDHALAEMLGEDGVEFAGAGEIMPERLLHHDPRHVVGEAMRHDLARERAEEVRRDRQVVGAYALRARQLGKPVPAAVALGVDRRVVDHAHERVEALGVHAPRRRVANRRSGHFAVGVRVHFAPRRPDDADIPVNLSGAEAPVQRRQDLLFRQIPGAAKDDQIEGIYRYDPGNHRLSPAAGGPSRGSAPRRRDIGRMGRLRQTPPMRQLSV